MMENEQPAHHVRGARVWNTVHKCPGVVHNTPRPYSQNIAVQLEGNIAFNYYPKRDIVPVDSAGVPVQDFPVNGSEPAAAQPEKLFPLVSQPAAPMAHKPNAYNGDLTLERLITMRDDLRTRLFDLDEKIDRIRITEMIRKAFGELKPDGETQERVALSIEALKIKQDTQKALDAATRLIAKGAL
jgi:hypothetical protein